MSRIETMCGLKQNSSRKDSRCLIPHHRPGGSGTLFKG